MSKILDLMRGLTGDKNTRNVTAQNTPAAGNDTKLLATTEWVQDELAPKAPLASPALTGTPTAPTTPLDDATLKLMNTAAMLAAFNGAGKQLMSGPGGYQKLPGGLIIQWGKRDGVNNSGGVNVVFPIAFPTECFVVVATHVSPASTAATRNVEVVIRGPSYFDAYGNTTANSIYWIALGR